MQHSATYSPQDNKIRLYFAFRVPREEWDALRSAGFTWTMKQKEAGGCDMVAPWTPEREDIALDLAGEIDDEDQPREERAAQRAERFEGYQRKREGEALGHADNYEKTPSVHGHQNERRAEREAERHDRQATRAVSQWSKADYWQRRTAGVIAHALYSERPDVRHRRIKGIESEMRRMMANIQPSKVIEGIEVVRKYCGQEYVDQGHNCVGIFGQGRAKYARSFKSENGKFEFTTGGQRWYDHYAMRIAYEKQMLAAQGGTVADASEQVIAGGFFGTFQIYSITKDKAGRLNKVGLIDHRRNNEVHFFKAEKMKLETYRAPTAEEAAAHAAMVAAVNASKPKAAPLVNPTDADAERLQAAWNAQRSKHKPSTVRRMTMAEFKAKNTSIQQINNDGTQCKVSCSETGVVRVRKGRGTGEAFWSADSVIVITDALQKPLPISWNDTNTNDAAELIRSCQALLDQVAQ